MKFYRMILRPRYCKRITLLLFIFGVSFYLTVLLFGDFKTPKVMQLTDLNRCPACYGISVCPELYSNQIRLENHHWQSMFFNAKNVYYGYTRSNRRIALKKLAHDWELKDFDSKLCKYWKLEGGCKPLDLLNVTNIEKKIEQLVFYNFQVPEIEPRKGLIFCPYSYGIQDFIQPAITNKKSSKNYKSDLINIWTMLRINPEPIILQVIPKSKGWRVPAFGGVCGRLEVVAYEGEPLNTFQDAVWTRKLTIAKHLLDAAMDFTFKHDRFRFYLMDWSVDNIVVNERDEVTFVDLEDIIVLDKHISPKTDLPQWYKRYSRDHIDEANIFSIEDICKHHLADHNIYSACHILGGGEGSLLHPMPVDLESSTQLAKLLRDCLRGPDRLKTATLLQHHLSEIITKKNR